MKKILIVFLFLLLSQSGSAQLYEWEKFVPIVGRGGKLMETGIDSVGNIYVAGLFTDSMRFDLIKLVQPPWTSPSPIYFAKFDTAGNIIWAKFIDRRNAFSPFLFSTQVDKAGNLYAIGQFSGSISIESTTLTSSQTSTFIIKLNSDGEVQWGKVYDFYTPELVLGAALDKNDNLYFTANISSSTSVNFDGKVFSSSVTNGNSIFLININPVGSVIWGKEIITCTGTFNPIADLDIDKNLHFSISGKYSSAIQLGTYSFINSNPGQNNYNSYVAKSDTSGSVIWAKSFSNLRSPIGTLKESQVAVDDLGNTYFTSAFIDSINFGNNIYLNRIGAKAVDTVDGFIVKFSPNGIAQWAVRAGTSNVDVNINCRLSVVNNMEVYWAGFLLDSGLVGNQPVNRPGLKGFLCRLDQNGGIQEVYDLDFVVSKLASGKSNNVAISGTELYNYGFFIASIKKDVNYIKGKVYYDLNANNVFDPTDKGSDGLVISLLPTGFYQITQQNGYYNLRAGVGNYNVLLPDVPKHYTAPITQKLISFANLNNATLNIDFALVPQPNVTDMAINIEALTPARPGFNMDYIVHVKNVGTIASSGTVSVTLPADISYNSSLPSASVVGQILTWNYNNLQPNTSQTYTIQAEVSATVLLGMPVNVYGSITPSTTDAFLEDNFYFIDQIVVGSIDPNDKLVNRPTISPLQISDGKYLDYTIRFQNTGTDTAFTVIVVDTLSSDLFVPSFQMLSSSHKYTYSLRGEGIVEWRFTNILLPDSNRNEPKSHGFVKFRIKPQTTLQLGDSITNSAAIYFDFNSPVITNTAVTRIMNPTAINKQLIKNISQLYLYPNPATESFMVEADLEKPQPVTLHLHNLLGQQLQKIELGKQQKIQHKLSVQNLPKGMYLLQLQAGAETITQRVIVE